MKNIEEELFEMEQELDIPFKDRFYQLANESRNDKKELLLSFMHYWNDTDESIISEEVIQDFINETTPLNTKLNSHIKA